MVNTKIVSRYTGPLPEGVDRSIPGGPLYSAQEVLELLVRGEQAVRVWTLKCSKDMQKWGLDTDDLVEIIGLALGSGRFITSEWCMQKPNGAWAACDAYSVIRDEWIPAARKEMGMEYYVKFSIGKTGTIMMVVSCHPSEQRR